MMDLIAIFANNNVWLSLMISVLVLPSDKTSFIPYLCMRMWMFPSSTTNVQTKCKRCDNETSVKLWHCHLGHISRGTIEWLIKEEILHPLDFLDTKYCIDCIKGKHVKKIKKGAKQSAGVLEKNTHRHLWSISRKDYGRLWFIHNVYR
jgi:hypothetical protein